MSSTPTMPNRTLPASSSTSHHRNDGEDGGDDAVVRATGDADDIDQQQKHVLFPELLHRALRDAEDRGLADVVSWRPDGKTFQVHRRDVFLADILPQYFKQSRYKSFARQLNLWGFRFVKKGVNKGGYFHELFVRDDVQLSLGMKRIKIKGRSPSARGPSTVMATTLSRRQAQAPLQAPLQQEHHDQTTTMEQEPIMVLQQHHQEQQGRHHHRHDHLLTPSESISSASPVTPIGSERRSIESFADRFLDGGSSSGNNANTTIATDSNSDVFSSGTGFAGLPSTIMPPLLPVPRRQTRPSMMQVPMLKSSSSSSSSSPSRSMAVPMSLPNINDILSESFDDAIWDEPFVIGNDSVSFHYDDIGLSMPMLQFDMTSDME